jgi:peptide deformylase
MNNIIVYPNPLLREKSAEVKLPLSKEDKALLDEMYAWLKEHNDTAVGLSAIQVGIPKRMCVIKHTMPSGKVVNYKLVNPKIIRRSSKTESYPEGCLSVAEEHDEPITRAAQVMIMAYDAIQNKNIAVEAIGFLARVFQHEIDHMDGKLYIDYIDGVQK